MQLRQAQRRNQDRLRYELFQVAKLVVAYAGEFKKLHAYYTARQENLLKKIQSLIVIACKLLRVIYIVLAKGTIYGSKEDVNGYKMSCKIGNTRGIRKTNRLY